MLCRAKVLLALLGDAAAPMVQKVMTEYFKKKQQRVPTQVAAIMLGGSGEAVGSVAGARDLRGLDGAMAVQAPLSIGALP